MVAERDAVFVVGLRVATFVVFAPELRGDNTDVRTPERDADTDFVNRCVLFVFVPFFARDATPPSRTAPPAPPIHIRADTAKIRTLFISDEILANL